MVSIPIPPFSTLYHWAFIFISPAQALYLYILSTLPTLFPSDRVLRRLVSCFLPFPGVAGKEMSWRCCGPDSGKSNFWFSFALWYLDFFIFDISFFLLYGICFLSVFFSVLASYLWTGMRAI